MRTSPSPALRAITSAAALPFLFFSISAATSFAVDASSDTANLETIQVTANRTEQSITNTLHAVTVLTRSDIEASTATSLEDLLSRLAGVNVAKTGGAGQTASVFVRSTESDHLLVMVNGMRLASVTTGAAALNLIPLEQIERIEFVRGSRSGVYGSEAIGGVLQIFTTTNASGGYASIEAGSSSIQNLRGGYNWSSDKVNAGFTVTHNKTDAIDAFKNMNPDKDGYDNKAFTLNLKGQVSDKVSISGKMFKAEGETDFDTTYSTTLNDVNKFVQQAISITADHQITDSFSFTVDIGQSRDEMKTRNDITAIVFTESFFNSSSDQASIKADFSSKGSLNYSLAYDFRNDQIDDSSAIFKQTARDNHGLYAGIFYAPKKHQFQADIRIDDNEAFGNHTTGTLGYGLQTSNRIKISTTIATGLKTPTFSDLYYPDSPPFYYSNPDLQPETSQSLELGISQHSKSNNWRISLFQNDISDLITFSGTTMVNLDEARIRGIELEGGLSVATLEIQGNISWIDAEDKNTGEALLRRPKQSAAISLGRSWNNFSASLQAHYVGKSEDMDWSAWPAARVELDAYSLLDLKLDYQLSNKLELFASFTNILDKEYETVLNYNQPGFESLIGLRFRQ